MPRIIDSESNCHDFCQVCMPDEQDAERLFARGSDGPDGRGNCFGYDETLHPDYEEDDFECETCGCKLTAKDN